jgi:hypothetical protein
MEVIPFAGKLAEPAAFKEWHILAISQTICPYRNQQKMMAVARRMQSLSRKSQYGIL